MERVLERGVESFVEDEEYLRGFEGSLGILFISVLAAMVEPAVWGDVIIGLCVLWASA